MTNEKLMELRLQSIEQSDNKFKAAKAKYFQNIFKYQAACNEIRSLLLRRGMDHNEINYALTLMPRTGMSDGSFRQLTYRGVRYSTRVKQ